ncbi:MAG: carbohydrate ABC transporter substrate-binding protein [Oscillospiraceae bacterium]|nr:carbohydrate ABC transporter substrate-binding protein [Oscillospiraceae bacterium]
MKKAISLLAALALIASFTACGDSTPAGNDGNTADSQSSEVKESDSESESESEADTKPAGDKGVINLYAFTDEVPKMVNKFVELHPDFGYTINDTQIPTTDGLYQPALDQALADGSVDMFAAEAAFVLKYTQGEGSKYVAPYEDLGIDLNEVKTAEIAQYTVDIGTNPDGKLVGLGYQATGGAFIYRRSIAQDAFGSEEPADVQKEIGPGWDKFFEAAEKLKAKGYGIVSGDGDMWHAVENSSDKGWVVDGKLTIDPKREEFLDFSKKLMDNNYHNDTTDWTDNWYADMAGTGEKQVLGFFGPAWLINYVMAGNSGGEKPGEGTYGDWAVCEPPVGFFWGGTWVLGTKDSDKKEAVGQIIEWITLNTDEDGLQYMWANGTFAPNEDGTPGTKDTVGSNVVMKKSNGEVSFLGGQNMFDVFVPANENATGKNLTPYDEDINSLWRDQVRQYAHGEKDRDTALADFKQAVSDKLDIEAAE